MIRAGTVDDIRWSNGTWLILDIGFSSKDETCGILLDEKEELLTFNNAVKKVIEVANVRRPLNLVIEAPLSVAFDKTSHNPKNRNIDYILNKDNKPILRPWYYGAGCTVMVATMYLMRELYDSCPSADVKLFEGFVSFKSKKNKSNHSDDVKCLRDAIKGEGTRNYRIYKPEELEDECANVVSVFKLMNMDLDIPPVIKIEN